MGLLIRGKAKQEDFNFGPELAWFQGAQLVAYAKALSDKGHSYLDDPSPFLYAASWGVLPTSAVTPFLVADDYATLVRWALVETFADREDIDAVYLQVKDRHARATILTRHETYDREAMSALFEREFQVREALKYESIEIDYIPLLGRNPRDLVSDNATLIYHRE